MATVDEVDEFAPSTVRAANTTPLKTHAFRYSFPKSSDGNAEALHDFKALHPSISEALVALGTARFIFQLEKTVVVFPGEGDDDDAMVEYGANARDNWHYQGYLELQTKTRAITLGRKLGSSGFPGIEVSPSSTLGRDALRTYCMKDVTRVDGPWADRPLSEVRDAIEMSDPAAAKKNFGFEFNHLSPAQQDIVNRIQLPPPSGVIDVLCDVLGNRAEIGKSTACKYCVHHHNAHLVGWGSARDIKYNVSKNLYKQAYFFDLARAGGGGSKAGVGTQETELWQAVEEVKSYMFQVEKYESRTVTTKPCHVIVLCNKSPDEVITKLSAGRVRIWVPKKYEGLIRWVHMDSNTGSFSLMSSVPIVAQVPRVFDQNAVDMEPVHALAAGVLSDV